MFQYSIVFIKESVERNDHTITILGFALQRAFADVHLIFFFPQLCI